MPIQVQEASRTPNRLDQNKTTPGHIIIKTTSTENRERILKAVRGKKQITYKGKPIKITDFSMETLKVFYNKQKPKQYMTTKPPLQKNSPRNSAHRK
jgi:hypothetical protein